MGEGTGWFWWLAAINLVLIFIGRASTLTWILLGLQALLFLVAVVMATAPPAWGALTKERPNSLLWMLGAAFVVGLFFKIIG